MYSRKGKWVTRIKNTDSSLELLLLPVICSSLIRGCCPRKAEWNVYVYFGCLSANPETPCLSQFHCHLNEKVGHWAGVAEPCSHHLPAWPCPGGSHLWQRGSKKHQGTFSCAWLSIGENCATKLLKPSNIYYFVTGDDRNLMCLI